MVDLWHLIVLFLFCADFLYSDLAEMGMEFKHFIFWGAAALAINLSVGLITILVSLAFFMVFIVGGEWLSGHFKVLGAGDWYFLGVAIILFPFPDFYWGAMPVGVFAFLLAGLGYMAGTIMQLHQTRKPVAFGAFLSFGLVIAVLMMQTVGTSF